MTNHSKYLFLLSTYLCLIGGSSAHAEAFAGLGSLGGAGISVSSVVSADGSTVAGVSSAAGGLEAFRWTLDDGITGLGDLGSGYSTPVTISANGSVVGVMVISGGIPGAYRWTQANGLVSLGNIGGGSTTITAMDSTGSTIIGNNGGSENRGYRWTQANNMQSLGDLGGGTSTANAISSDGSTIVGYSNNGSADEAFRWIDGVGMQGLGTLGGTTSEATAASADGSVIVGQSHNGSYNEAFRWTAGGGMQGLGELQVGYGSSAKFVSSNGNIVSGQSSDHGFRWVNGVGMQDIGSLGGSVLVYSMSADGSVIAGESDDGSLSNYQVYRWTQASGMKSLTEILTDAGIDLTGWTQLGGLGVASMSADGNIIASGGTYNGAPHAFIFSMGNLVSGGGGGGIITPEELAQTLSSTADAAQQVQSSVVSGTSQSMFVARNALTGYFPRQTFNPAQQTRLNANTLNDEITPSAGGTPRLLGTRRKAIYALGNMGIGQNNQFSNHAASGTTGMLVEVADHFAIGAGAIASTNREDTRFDGHNQSTALGGNIIAAYEPPSGLRLYTTATVASLDLTTRRHYMNGGGIDSSKGDTDGMGYGVAVRGGYEFDVAKDTYLMPYADAQASHTTINGYTETGGGFPAAVGDQSDNLVTSRLGAELSHDVTPRMTVRGRGAWGHRYTDAGSTIATSVGLTQIIPGTDGDRDWAEAGATINYALSEQTSFTGDISGRAGKTAEPAVSATIGFIWRW